MQLHTGYARQAVQIYTISVNLFKFRSCNYVQVTLDGLFKYTLYMYTCFRSCNYIQGMLDGLYKYSLYLYTFTSLVHATTYGVR